MNVGRREAKARMAHLLCEMGVRMAQARLGDRDRFELHVTQSQLADALGLTSVHVNRVLQSLRADGVIATAGREIRIHDWGALTAIGDFDPIYLETRGSEPVEPAIHASPKAHLDPERT